MMSKNYLKSIQLVIAFFMVSVMCAQTITPSDDAYVNGGNKKSINYGSDPEILVQGTQATDFRRRGFMKFDLTGYSSVTSATFNVSGKMRSGDEVAPITVTIYSIDDATDSWSEGTITDNNDPTLSSSNIITTFDALGSDEYSLFSVDLTTYVNTVLASGHQIVSIGFKDAPKTSEQFIMSSKEGTEAAPNITLVGASVLSVENVEISEFSMYPNPVQDSFEIKYSNSKINNVKIFSVNGSLVFNSDNVKSNSFKVDVTSLESGVYFVEITDKQGESSVKKLIKE